MASEFPQEILDCVSRLENDRVLPLVIPDETIAFLKILGNHCDSALKPLGQFFLGIGISELEEALIGVAMPDEVLKHRTAIEKIEIEKGAACINHKFDLVAKLRDDQKEIMQRIRHALGGDVKITPDHVKQAIANLGYTKTISI